MTYNSKCYCPSCMSIINDGEKCSCGFDEAEYKEQSQWLPIGTVLHDSILIGKVIGNGGFGITYVGIDLNLEKKVAVKEFYMSGICGRNNNVSPDVLTEGREKTELFETNKNKFIDEARILARFSEEPGIVTVNRFFKENNTAYIVMEYVEGYSIVNYVAEKGKLNVKDMLYNIVPIIRALEKMHAQHVYHRDISPDNIILTKKQGMKLLDFGSAREKTDEYQTMTVVFKNIYSPVEQRESHGNQGPWTDIYSLCATMYYCITGQIPESAYDRYMNDRMLKAHEIEPSCPEELGKIIAKGMQVYVEDRYQSVDELKKALEDFTDKNSSIFGKGFFSRSRDLSEDEESENKKKDYFIVKKKVLMLVAAVMAGILIIAGIATGIAKSMQEKDKQLVYLTYPEDADPEEIKDVQSSIKGRLEELAGKGNYRMRNSTGYSEIEFEAGEGKCYTNYFLNNYLFRPDRLALVYSAEYIDEKIDIETGDIVSIEKISIDEINNDSAENSEEDSEEGVGESTEDLSYINSQDGYIYYIELTDSAAETIAKKREDWISKTEPSERTYNNLGGAVISYKDYDPFSTDPELNTLQTEVMEPADIVNACIRLMFDYDMWKSGEIKDAERTIIEIELSDDCKKIYIKTSGDYECIKSVIDNHFNSNSFDVCIDVKSTFPVIWERNLNKSDKEDNILRVGKYQKEPGYFSKNNIECVDVVFKREDEKGNMGDWVNYRKYIQDVFDKMESEYAIGKFVGDEYSLVIRIPDRYAGGEFYSILKRGSQESVMTLGRKGEEGNIDTLTKADADYISWPITFVDNKVCVNLVPLADYRVSHSDYEGKDYSGFTLKLGGKIYWQINASNNGFLVGEYDKDATQLIFSQSTYAEDGSIPEDFINYIDMLNSVYSVDTTGYNFHYNLSKDQSGQIDYGSQIEAISYKLSNHVNDTIVQNTKNKLAETLGVEPEAYFDYGTLEVILKQSITDNYAKNLTRIINAIIDANLFNENDIFTLYSSKSLFRIVNLDGKNQANIDIDDKEKLITLYFWREDLTDEEKAEFDIQLQEMKTIIEEGNDFAGYTVEINNVKSNKGAN